MYCAAYNFKIFPIRFVHIYSVVYIRVYLFCPRYFFLFRFFFAMRDERACDHLLSICTRIYVYTRSLTRSIPFVCGVYSPTTFSGQQHQQQWRQQQHHHNRNNRIKLYFVCSLPDILAFMASLSMRPEPKLANVRALLRILWLGCFQFDFRRDGKNAIRLTMKRFNRLK